MSTVKKSRIEGQDVRYPRRGRFRRRKSIVLDKLRSDTGLITLEPRHGNTAFVYRADHFIDGGQGHPALPRLFPSSRVARARAFHEVCYLLI